MSICGRDCDLSQFANLIGWYDSSDRSTIVFDENNLISEWKDKSGHNNHLIQPLASRRGFIEGEFTTTTCDTGPVGEEIGIKTSKNDVWMYNKGPAFRFLGGFTFFVVLKGQELIDGWKNILSFQWMNRGISLLCKDTEFQAIQKTSASWNWAESPVIDVGDAETSFLVTYSSDNVRGGVAKMEINKLESELTFTGDPVKNLYGRLYVNSTEISSMCADWLYHEIAVFNRKLEDYEKEKIQGMLAMKWHLQDRIN
jgi:hypothetical protein